MIEVQSSVFAMLNARFRPVVTRHAGMAFALWGDPGVGKTWTARHFLRQAGSQVFELHAKIPLLELARALPRPRSLAAWATSSLALLERGEQTTSSAAVNALGTQLAALAPVVLHLEDLHEASPEQLEFWTGLAQVASRTRGVGLLVTSRAAPPEPFVALRIEPLDRDGTHALLEAEFEAQVPSEAVGWIHARAAGNPLFTLEYARYLAKTGHLWSDRYRWRWRAPPQELMPTTVEALIERLIDESKTSAAIVDALEAKALIGREASTSLWTSVSNLPLEVLRAVRANLERRNVFCGEEFVHPLFGEVVLRGLLPARRRNFARRALEALVAERPEMASEFLRDADLEPAASFDLLQRAAERSSEAGSSARAARLRAQALAYATDADRGRLALRAAKELYGHDLDGAIRLAGEAARLLPDDLVAFGMYAIVLAEAGRRDEVERALERCPPHELDGQFVFRVKIECLLYLQEYGHLLALWAQHPELHAKASVWAVRGVAHALAETGDGEGGLRLASSALERPEGSAVERACLLEVCGIASRAMSDHALAEQFYLYAIQLFRDDGQGHRVGSLLFNRANALLALGRYLEARADIEESLRLASRQGHAGQFANAKLLLGEVLREVGEYERAEEALHECCAFYLRNQLMRWQVDTEIALGTLYRDWSSPHAPVLARKHGDTALALARRLNDPQCLAASALHTAVTEARYGSLQRAAALLNETHAIAKPELRPEDNASTAPLATPGLVGSFEEPPWFVFRWAEAAYWRVGMPVEAQKIRLEVDRLCADPTGARERLAWFEERGLANGANIARRYFPVLTSPNPERTSRKITGLDEALPRLEVLGVMRWNRAGIAGPLRGQRRKALFARLVEARIAGRAEVPQFELLEALYSGEVPDEAAIGLKQVVFQARSSLGQGVIATTPAGYRLGPVDSDAEAFLRTGETGLWRGLYLEDGDQGRDETVRDALYGALLERIREVLETDPREAVRVGRLLLEAEPYDLEALRLTLKALRSSDNHRGAARLYASARARLLEVGEALPDSWTALLEAQPSL